MYYKKLKTDFVNEMMYLFLFIFLFIVILSFPGAMPLGLCFIFNEEIFGKITKTWTFQTVQLFLRATLSVHPYHDVINGPRRLSEM